MSPPDVSTGHAPASRPVAAVRRHDRRAGAQHRAVPRDRLPDHARPAVDHRRGPAGGARAAPDPDRAAARGRRRTIPTPDDLYRIGTVANIVRYVTTPEGGHHLICQGVQRFRITEFVEGHPFLMARGLHIAEPTADGLGDRGALPRPAAAGAARCSTCCRACRPSCARPSRRRPRPACWPTSPATYLDATPAEKQEHPRDDRPAAAARQGLEAAGPSAGGAAAVGRDRQQDQGVARHAPARGAAARADGRDPDASWATRAPTSRSWPTSRRRSPRPRCRPRSRRRQEGAAPAAAHARGGGRVRHDPHLPRHADRAALGAAGAQGHRHRRGAPRARRRSLRPGEDQAAHHRVPRRAQARAGGQGADPVLRRAAGRRQDLARPVDRPRHGPQVRARQPGRRA